MKKFIVMILAAACVAAAVPALAGDFTASGTYYLESIYFTSDKGILDGVNGVSTTDKYNDAYYQNDFELITTYTQGPVTATVDWEVTDANAKELYGHTISRSGRLDHSGDIVDNYFITWKASDVLTLKTGEYALEWGNKLAAKNQGGYNIGLTYGLDAVDLGLTIGQVAEGNYVKSVDETIDADETQYLISGVFKKAGPFTKANLYLLYDMQDKTTFDADSHTATLIAGEFAIPAGPVALSGEFGLFSGERAADFNSSGFSVTDVEGNYILLAAGLKDVVGFDLNATIFRSTDTMYAGYDEKWSPALILGGEDLDIANMANGNITLLKIDGSYAVSDKLTVGGTVLPIVQLTDKDTAGAPDSNVGTEIDATYSYKFADNVVLNGALGMFSAGDAIGEGSIMALYNKLTFKF